MKILFPILQSNHIKLSTGYEILHLCTFKVQLKFYIQKISTLGPITKHSQQNTCAEPNILKLPYLLPPGSELVFAALLCPSQWWQVLILHFPWHWGQGSAVVFEEKQSYHLKEVTVIQTSTTLNIHLAFLLIEFNGLNIVCTFSKYSKVYKLTLNSAYNTSSIF